MSVRHDKQQFDRFARILKEHPLLLPEYGHLCDQIVSFAKNDIKENELEIARQVVSYHARLFMEAVKLRVPAKQLCYFPRALVSLSNCIGVLPRQMELAREISPYLTTSVSEPSLATPRG